MSSHSTHDDSGDDGARGKLTDGTLGFSAPAAAYVKDCLQREGKGVSAIRGAAVGTH